MGRGGHRFEAVVEVGVGVAGGYDDCDEWLVVHLWGSGCFVMSVVIGPPRRTISRFERYGGGGRLFEHKALGSSVWANRVRQQRL